jgi:hypothetical protein
MPYWEALGASRGFLFSRLIDRTCGSRHMMRMRKIAHAYPPTQKRSKPKKPATTAKPAVVVTAKTVKQVDWDRRITRLRERGY